MPGWGDFSACTIQYGAGGNHPHPQLSCDLPLAGEVSERHRMFDNFIQAWALVPDGDPIVTHSSRLLPVRWRGLPAMLKVATAGEEKRGGLLMQWWNGERRCQRLCS